MPFPLAAAILGGSSILGSLFGGGKSKEEKRLMKTQEEAIRRQLALAERQAAFEEEIAREQFGMQKDLYGVAKGFIPGMERLLGAAEGDFSELGDRYERLLKGDEGLLGAELAPEANQINRSYEALLRRTAEGPRGGGRASLLSEAGARRSGDLINLLLGARKDAAKNMHSIGGAKAGLGGQYAGLISGLTGGGYGGSNAFAGSTAMTSSANNALSNLIGAESAASSRRGASIGGAFEGLGALVAKIGKDQGWKGF